MWYYSVWCSNKTNINFSKLNITLCIRLDVTVSLTINNCIELLMMSCFMHTHKNKQKGHLRMQYTYCNKALLLENSLMRVRSQLMGKHRRYLVSMNNFKLKLSSFANRETLF